MKSLWLDIGNTRLKYWITENDQVLTCCRITLTVTCRFTLGLIQHFRHQNLSQVGISSVLDTENNQRIQMILDILEIPIIFAQVHANYAGLRCGYDVPSQLGIDRWLQVLAISKPDQNFCVIGCGTADH
jgi:type III pantothenate kinase